jgi:hypothetical protein
MIEPLKTHLFQEWLTLLGVKSELQIMKGFGHVLGVFGKPFLSEWDLLKVIWKFFRPKVQEILNFEFFFKN